MRAIRVFLFLIAVDAAVRAEPCPSAGVLSPNGEIAGVLDESSCRSSSGAPIQQFRLHLPAPGKIALQVETEGPAPTTLIRDAEGRRIEGESLERGVYSVVVAAGENGLSGQFTLRSTFRADTGALCRTVRPLGLTDEADGSLSGASCRNPGDRPFDAFRIQTLGNGVIKMTLEGGDFPGEILLRSAAGKLVAAGRSELTADVTGGALYFAVVLGDNPEASGAYKLSSSFTSGDGDVCRNRALADSAQTVSDSVSTSSCPLGGDVFGHIYAFKTLEPGQAEIRLTGLNQNGLLVLLDRGGDPIAFDYNGDGVGKPFLRPYLTAGSYMLLVLAGRQGGEYTLDYKFTPGRPEACPVTELTDSVAALGSLSPAGCRGIQDLRTAHRFTTGSAGVVELVMASAEFDSQLTLRDAQDNVLVEASREAGLQAGIAAALPPGTYGALAASDRPGSYAIGYRLTARELPACQPAGVNVNAAYLAVLGAGPCLGPDGQPADQFEFQVPSDGTVAVFMTAVLIDAHLTLLDASGSPLRRDDNSYGGTDALILQFLPAGSYRVVARSAGGGQTGRYRLDILHSPGERPAGCRPARSLSPGESVQGTLNLTSCQWSDDTFADVFRIEAGEAGPREITLRSTRFDAYLELLDDKGNTVAFDDESAGGSDARISVDLQPGVYYVIAKSYAGDGYAAGEYTIALR